MKVSIKPNTYIFVVLLLLLLPIEWVVAWLLAIAFHELGHYLTVKLLGGQVYQLTIGLGGADMECSTLPDRKRLLAILGGPLGGILLIFLGKWLPRLAICSFILSIYNLFPMLPLDGGRALQIVLRERAFYLIERLFLLAVSLGAVYCVVRLQFWLLPTLIVAGIWVRNRKRPCKEGINKLQ